MNTVPDAQLILGYKEFFNIDPPSKRLEIIEGICKESLIAVFAGLNHRLKPKQVNYFDTSFETQIKELKYFCRRDELSRRYAQTIERYKTREKRFPLIFIRQTCLFALEEIVQSDLPVIDNFSMGNAERWDSVFKYLLAVNTVITAMGDDHKDELINFETLNPKMLPLNEKGLGSSLLHVPFRGLKFFEFLSRLEDTRSCLHSYFSETYSMTYEKFIQYILTIYIDRGYENEDFNFYYKSSDDKALNNLFVALSQKFDSTEIYKLLSIRKYPFYRFKNGDYVLVDNTMLLEKSYNQFINDFWFDYIKELKNDEGQFQIDIKKYKSIVGYFFESYVKEAIHYMFANAKYYALKLFDDLKVSRNGSEIEVADLYIRHNKKVILGQVKATSLYDKEKYSGNIDTMYKSDREGFFKSFGVDQLVNSIKILEDEIQIVDAKFPVSKPYQIFPVIIVNENALQTQLMPKIFQDRFSEFVFRADKKVHIYPLSIIHISDLERIEDILHKTPNEIWNLLKFHCRNPKFMPPFYNSLDKKDISTSTERALSSFKWLIENDN